MWDSFLDESFYEFPSFEVAIFSLLLAFTLSTVIAFTYKFTYRGVYFSGGFFQAMILASIATATIIMAVGDNLAVGFGIVGAIAIIRFRTRIGEPRNIIFIFAAIGVGIAAGVYGYAIAVAGTLIFCLVAIILHYSPFSKTLLFQYRINFNIADKNTLIKVLDYFEKNFEHSYLMELDEGKGGIERYEYLVELKEDAGQVTVYRELSLMEGVSNVSIQRRNYFEQL